MNSQFKIKEISSYYVNKKDEKMIQDYFNDVNRILEYIESIYWGKGVNCNDMDKWTCYITAKKNSRPDKKNKQGK